MLSQEALFVLALLIMGFASLLAFVYSLLLLKAWLADRRCREKTRRARRDHPRR